LICRFKHTKELEGESAVGLIGLGSREDDGDGAAPPPPAVLPSTLSPGDFIASAWGGGRASPSCIGTVRTGKPARNGPTGVTTRARQAMAWTRPSRCGRIRAVASRRHVAPVPPRPRVAVLTARGINPIS